MTEEYWANSPFSIARYSGSIRAFDHIFTIVNKEGKTIFELSEEAHGKGETYAIEPGEPCDLCRVDFIPLYRKLGRERFIEIVKENKTKSINEIKKIMKGASK